MATDTIRTQAELLTYLTPNNNTVPRTTALLAQTARDLIVTMFANNPFYSATALGWVGDGATENSAAMNATFLALPSGATLVLAPGVYQVDPTKLNPIIKAVTIMGGNPYVGVSIEFTGATNTTADCLTVTTGYVKLANLNLRTSTPRTAGDMLHLAGPDITLDGLNLDNYAVGIHVAGSSGCRMTRCRGSSIVSACVDVKFSAGGLVHNMDMCLFDRAAVTANSAGIVFTGPNTNTIRISHTFIGRVDIGLYFAPAAGESIFVIDIASSDVDTCKRPVLFDAGATGNISEVYLRSVWAGNSGSVSGGGNSVLLQGTGGAILNVTLENMTMLGIASGASAVKCTTSNIHGLVVRGGHGATISAHVVDLAANQDDTLVNGLYGATSVSGYGVNVPAGTTSAYDFSHNNFRFCTTGRIQLGAGVAGGTSTPNS